MFCGTRLDKANDPVNFLGVRGTKDGKTRSGDSKNLDFFFYGLEFFLFTDRASEAYRRGCRP
jgi:hypothetical protein